MSLFKDREKQTDSWIHRFCINVLKTGPIPKHIAFIMDGNRRYAAQNSMQTAKGHLMGFEKLADTLDWCRNLGVTEVTVYAFSIENFKRSKEEVDNLMELAKQKLEKLLDKKDLLHKHGICVRVLGDLSLLPRQVQEAVAEAVCATKDHDKATLNVCMPYTSREEITKAMQEIAEGVKLGLLLESDVSEELIEKCLYTNHSGHPDLLLRTSGEVRLSDFLLWQSAFSVLSFIKVLWPAFSVWHLYGAVLHYQYNYNAIKKAQDFVQERREQEVADSDYKCVTDEAQQPQRAEVRAKDCATADLQVKLDQYCSTRQLRIRTFLTHLDNKRTTFFETLCSKRAPTELSKTDLAS